MFPEIPSLFELTTFIGRDYYTDKIEDIECFFTIDIYANKESSEHSAKVLEDISNTYINYFNCKSISNSSAGIKKIDFIDGGLHYKGINYTHTYETYIHIDLNTNSLETYKEFINDITLIYLDSKKKFNIANNDIAEQISNLTNYGDTSSYEPRDVIKTILK